MDTFDNFQYDSASSYGGMGIVDDTSSVYTASTAPAPSSATLDLDMLSIVDDRSQASGPSARHHPRGHTHNHAPQNGGPLSEDFDAVLDDLKDEGQVDLPSHACWCVLLPR